MKIRIYQTGPDDFAVQYKLFWFELFWKTYSRALTMEIALEEVEKIRRVRVFKPSVVYDEVLP